MNYTAEYQLPGAPKEKTPQQRMEVAKRQLLELQDKRYIEKKEALDPNLYTQNYQYDETSYFARPFFTEEQKIERKAMIEEINDMSLGFGSI